MRVILTIAALAMSMGHVLPAQIAVRPSPDPGTAAALDTSGILASARPTSMPRTPRGFPVFGSPTRRRSQRRTRMMACSSHAHATATRHRSAIARMYAARFPQLHDIRAGAVVQGGLTVLGQMRIAEWGNAWLEIAPETKGGMPVRSGGTVPHHLATGDRRALANRSQSGLLVCDIGALLRYVERRPGRSSRTCEKIEELRSGCRRWRELRDDQMTIQLFAADSTRTRRSSA